MAAYFGATFTQFACTGATFANGIAAAQTDDGTQLRPAQFGNWATRAQLNAAYDAADPDVVLVTLGADDLQFVAIVEACIENGYEYYFDLADEECVASNPGSTIQTDYFDAVPQLQADYATLASWIAERAAANDRPVPQVVFTNYANPLPADGTKCPDTNWLYPEQVTYLSGLVDQLNATIASTIGGLAGTNVELRRHLRRLYAPGRVAHLVHHRPVGLRPVHLQGHPAVELRQPGPVPPDARRPGEHRRPRHPGGAHRGRRTADRGGRAEPAADRLPLPRPDRQRRRRSYSSSVPASKATRVTARHRLPPRGAWPMAMSAACSRG